MSEFIYCRESRKEDLPEILRIYAQPEMDDGKMLSLPEAERLFERIAGYPDYKIYVAISGEKVIGSFELLIMDNLGHLGARSAVIEDVVVDPEWQGRGVGKIMMQKAFQICNEKGCYKAVVSSNLKRERAHAFYKSLGFEVHGYSFHVSRRPGIVHDAQSDQEGARFPI